ncbi:hypothetical protein NDU88_003168 [Pleurodeles waltl]|uniref:Uncharacterized protein n=1 Tax=Pleurodeles waltl TaxID=8319 RepID=A0AAV7QEN4_PLEWA|nr:hypothetical protein NDU88_003168 [Pleurodeles waltl]
MCPQHCEDATLYIVRSQRGAGYVEKPRLKSGACGGWQQAAACGEVSHPIVLSLTAAQRPNGKTVSDHNPVEIQLHWGQVPVPIRTWHLQPMLLEDTVYRNTLATAIDTFFSENTDTANSPLIAQEAFKVIIQGFSISMLVGVWVKILKDLTHLENNLGALEQEATLEHAKAAQLQTARIRQAELLERLHVVVNRSYTQRTHVEVDKPGALLAKLIMPRNLLYQRYNLHS